jgi:protein-S-isoprenylcysteine O-methyltransferase Ste14
MIIIAKLILLTLGSGVILWVSRRSLRDSRSHGFYRFFAWESILILIVLNLGVWFHDPLAYHQIISWFLLVISLFLVYQGMRLLRERGVPDPEREGSGLVGLEKTTQLVTSGVYAYIRHPLYSSLLFLAWGAFLKQPSWTGVCLAGIATFFLTLTARTEEVENMRYFGDAYRNYIRWTKMFIPFLF